MTASHVNFSGRSEAVFTVTLLFMALSTLFVFLRIISRQWLLRRLCADDYLIVLAWAIAVGIATSICYGCAYGLGRHEDDIPPEWQQNLRIADYAFSVMYQPALMSLKTSILAFYLALPTSNKYFKWACIATLVVVNAGGLALGLFTVFQCTPVDDAFIVPTPAHSHCTDVITIYLSSTPLNLITDLAILFLPMPILTGMRLPQKQKIILLITFSFGAFVAAVDVVRVVYLQSASETRLTELYHGKNDGTSTINRTDFSWYASFSFMWSAIEVNVGIMVACVPGLKPLVTRFLPNMLRSKGDPPSKTNSVDLPNGRIESQAPLPGLPLPVRGDSSNSNEPDYEDEGGEMGMMDFLTTPEMTDFPRMTPIETARANSSRDTRRLSTNFFDFVDMENKKSLVKLTNRESVYPIAMVTVLFFIWGFEYGLLDVLNTQFQRVAHMSPTQGTGIHSAYYAGYFFGPLLVGRLVLKHWGFKACFTVGLSIYGCGTLIFWPAAVLASFPAFVVTNFIIAFGLSILEVSANPFIALCGPPRYNEIRLNLSQGVQAIGSVVAPLIADKAFIRQNLHTPSLVDTQWAYLGISLFTIFLAVAYYYVPLPEATDEELEDAAERLDGANTVNVYGMRIIWITLAFGVFGQFCYVGAQEVNGTSFKTYLRAIAPTYDAANYMAVAHTAFAVSRFLAAGLCFFIQPRILMLFYFLGAIVFEVLAMNYSGSTGTAMIIMVFFFEGPLFSLIFAQALRGLGRYTKIGSVFLAASISGGSVFSPISNQISLNPNRAMYSLVVGAAVFAAGTLFPLWLNISPLARKQCDPPPKEPKEEVDSDRPSSTGSQASNIKFGVWDFGKERAGGSTGVDWNEGRPS